MKIKHIYLAGWAAVALLALGCGTSEPYMFSAETMGTSFSATIYNVSKSAGEQASEKAYAEVERINALMSTWLDDSPMSVMNREARSGWAQADPEILSLVETAFQYSEKSEGAFDVTAGPLVRLWGFFARVKKMPPSQAEIEEAMSFTGWHNISLDPERSMVLYHGDGMEIDLGGIAKGYAVDRAIGILHEDGYTDMLINIGGNIGAVGSPEGRSSWNIAVRDPRQKSGFIGTLNLPVRQEQYGIASSGQYERYFEYEGKRYGHIIDPRTGYPVEGVLGTTIVATTAELADVLSTAVFVQGEEKGKALVLSEGVEALIILPDGPERIRILLTPGLFDGFALADGAGEVKLEILK